MTGDISPTTHLSWGIEIPVCARPDEALYVRRAELHDLTRQTTEACISQIGESFSLEQATIDGMWNRVADLDVILVDGRDYGEYSRKNPEKLFLGPATFALAETITIEEAPDDRQSIFLSIKSINAEMANLTAVREPMQTMLVDDPDLVKGKGLDRLKDLEDPERCKQVAIALSYARRLIKYGLLPDDCMPKDLRSNFGFSDWLEHCKEISGREKDFTKGERKVLTRAYESEGLAIKNLRRTVWTELFYGIVGVDPQRDPFFYMLYYTPALGVNNGFTITFNDERTCNINSAETGACLSAIFNSAGHKLRSV